MINQLISEVDLHKKMARFSSHAIKKAKSPATNCLERQLLRDKIIAKEEQIIKRKDSILEYEMIIDEMNEEYEGNLHTYTTQC